MKKFCQLKIGDKIHFLTPANTIESLEIEGIKNPNLHNKELEITLLEKNIYKNNNYSTFTIKVPYNGDDFLTVTEKDLFSKEPIVCYVYGSLNLKMVQNMRVSERQKSITRLMDVVKQNCRELKKLNRSDYEGLKYRIQQMFKLIDAKDN